MLDFTDLVLLIGTNPLPNFVVAQYFLRHNRNLQNIWLVYSEETGLQEGTVTQANNLEKVLERRDAKAKGITFPLQKVSLSNVSDAQQVFQDVNDKLISKLRCNCRIHLNYTGGTKVMATHVYKTIDKESSKISDKSFSYLDSRGFQVVDDKYGIITGDLREEISLTFDELIELHGFRRKNEDSDSNFSNAVEAFESLINEERLDEYFTSYNRTLFESKKKPGSLARKVSELREKELNKFTPSDTFLSIVEKMPEGYRLFDPNGNFLKPQTNRHCKYAIGFLDGLWLEDYISSVLKSELGYPNTEVLKHWVIDKSGWSTEFQLDVILLRGYQLIGISCTTSSKKEICKNKGFEIIHRSRQIGGEEAKAILVAMVNEGLRRSLQEELELDTGGTSANILVLGKEDLKRERLSKKVKDFVA